MEQQMIRVEDVMTTALVTVFEDDALDVASMEMDVGKLRHLPVVSREHPGHLVGLITHRDLLKVAGRAFLERATDRDRMLRQVPIGDVMRHKVQTVQPDDPAAAAGRRMLEAKIGCLPVVDETGTLVGILTEADLVRIAVEQLEDNRDEGD